MAAIIMLSFWFILESDAHFCNTNAGEAGAVAALVSRIGQLELLLKQALEQHNASEKENVDLRSLLHRFFFTYQIQFCRPRV